MRQVDARQEPDSDGCAHAVRRRPRRARRQGASDLGRQEDEPLPVQGRLDHSPVRAQRAEPDAEDRDDGDGAPRIAGHPSERRGARVQTPPEARRAVRGRAGAIPDRALGRDEAARRDGALVPARSLAPDRRRGDVGARRVDPASRVRAARGVPRPRLRQEHDRDHARPLGPVPDRRHDPRHVRRQARREGAGGDGRRRAGAPLHADAPLVASRGRRAVRGEAAERHSRPPAVAPRAPTGCRFRARCPLAFEKCAEEPPFVEVAPGQKAACWKAAA